MGQKLHLAWERQSLQFHFQPCPFFLKRGVKMKFEIETWQSPTWCWRITSLNFSSSLSKLLMVQPLGSSSTTFTSYWKMNVLATYRVLPLLHVLNFLEAPRIWFLAMDRKGEIRKQKHRLNSLPFAGWSSRGGDTSGRLLPALRQAPMWPWWWREETCWGCSAVCKLCPPLQMSQCWGQEQSVSPSL